VPDLDDADVDEAGDRPEDSGSLKSGSDARDP
jgi:hypothetical protein